MAGVLDRIRVIFDLETANFNRGLSGVRADVAAADGLFNKAKVGAKGLGDQLSQYAAPAAMAAGAALVTFGTKSVKAFTDTALAAGKFSDSAGVSVETASRWIAVGDDFGITAETIQGSFMKMNKAIASGGGDLERYGIAVKRTADGNVDANATFIEALRVIGQMPDSADRAAAAQAVFGKSYSEISRLIETDSGAILSALNSVSDAQVIDQGELDKARDYQAAMDNLGDVVRDLALALGETLTPAVSTVADTVTGVADAFGSLPDPVQDVASKMLGVGAAALGTSKAFGFLASHVGGGRKALGDLAEGADDAAGGLSRAGAAAKTAGIVGAAAMGAFAMSAAQAADEARDAAEAMDDLARASDDKLWEEFSQAIAENFIAANFDLEQAFADMAEANVGALIRIRDFIDASGGAAAVADDMGVSVAQAEEQYRLLQAAISNETASQAQANEAAKQASTAVDLATDALDDNEDAADDAATAITGAAAASDELAAAYKGAGDEIQRLSDLLAKNREEAQNHADANRAAEAAGRDFADAMTTLGGTMLDTEASAADVEDATWAAAESAIDWARKISDAGGAAEGSQEKQDDFRVALQGIADTLAPGSPLRVQLEQYIADLRGIPSNITTTLHVNQEGTVSLPGGNDIRRAPGAGGLMDRFTRWGATVIKGKGTSILSNSLWDQVFGILGVGSGGGSGGGSDDGGKPGKPGKPTMPKPPDDPDKRKGVSDSEAAKIRKDVDKASRMYERGKLTADEYLAVLKDAAKSFKPLSDFGMWLYREIQRVRQDIKDAADKPDRKPKPEPRDPWEVAAAKQERGEARDALKAAGIDLYTAMTDDDTSNDRAAQERWADAIYADIVARANVKHRPQTRQWASFVRGLLEKNIEKNSDLPHTVRKLRLYLRGIPEFDDTPSGESNTGGDGGRDMRSALAAAAAADPALKAQIAAAIKAKSAGNGGAPTGQVKVLVASDDRQLAQWMGNQISKLNAEQG